MNKMRRSKLRDALKLLEQANEIVTEIWEEEEDSYDNLPSGIQESDLGCDMEENVDNLSEALDSITSAQDYISGVIER